MPFNASNTVAIVGVGQSAIGRKLDRPTGALAVDAALAAIDDAGLTLADIDGISTFPESTGPGVGPREGHSSASLSWMVQGLGVERLDWWANGGGNISTAIGYAIHALAADSCRYVLVWRAMHQPRAGGFGSGARAADGASAPVPRVSDARAYTAPYGLTDAPSYFASSYLRYMKLYGAQRHHMATYAITMRENANNNPAAVFRGKPLTYEGYMSARMIAEPLCLLDCDMPVDGAGALILTRADRARDLRRPPAYITAYGSGGWDWRLRPPEEYAISTAGNLGRTLWGSTDLTPADMDGAMLYDGFSPDIYWWLEGLQFCEPGSAYEWIQDGRIGLGGELPVNTFGGQLSEGRLHGIGHWIEATRQIQRRADNEPGDGARQIANAQNVLVATGMTGHGSGVILSDAPR